MNGDSAAAYPQTATKHVLWHRSISIRAVQGVCTEGSLPCATMSSPDPDDDQDRSMYPPRVQEHMAKERDWHRFLRGADAMSDADSLEELRRYPDSGAT